MLRHADTPKPLNHGTLITFLDDIAVNERKLNYDTIRLIAVAAGKNSSTSILPLLFAVSDADHTGSLERARAHAHRMVAAVAVGWSVPAKTIQRLEEELQQLKKAQDRSMALAIYVGMTATEARAYDERRKRIYELYDEVLYLRKQEYGKTRSDASGSL